MEFVSQRPPASYGSPLRKHTAEPNASCAKTPLLAISPDIRPGSNPDTIENVVDSYSATSVSFKAFFNAPFLNPVSLRDYSALTYKMHGISVVTASPVVQLPRSLYDSVDAMKSFLILLSSIAPTVLGLSFDRRGACNADNCARAVTGTAFGTAALSSHISQCSSYFSATVIPPSTTVWNAVATSYVFSSVGADLPPSVLPSPTGTSTTVIPSNIPDFASAACDGNTTPVPVRYSSACSCAGVTKATTTAPSPTAAVDYTATVTVSTFLIVASGTSLPQPEFLYTPLGNIENSYTEFTTDITHASGFVLSSNELQLLSDGFLGNENAEGLSPLYFNSANQIGPNASYGYAAVAVTIGQDLSVSITNEDNGYSVLQDCDGLLEAFNSLVCDAVSLSVVPLS
ncbi:hypothetical protein B7463_g11081, partial [Scytalidium lignicola]